MTGRHGPGGGHHQRISSRTADTIQDFGDVRGARCRALQIEVSRCRLVVVAALAIVGDDALDLGGITHSEGIAGNGDSVEFFFVVVIAGLAHHQKKARQENGPHGENGPDGENGPYGEDGSNGGEGREWIFHTGQGKGSLAKISLG